MLLIHVCTMTSLATLFIYLFIFSQQKINTIKTFFNEHQLISISDTVSNMNFHIVPYKEILLSYNNGLIQQYAQYNTTSANDTHVIMYFTKPREYDNISCLNTFNLYLICDLFQKYYPTNIIKYNDCNYDFKIFTDAICLYIFSERNEL